MDHRESEKGKIEAEGGFSDYESLRASIAVPLMYSNAKCKAGPRLVWERRAFDKHNQALGQILMHMHILRSEYMCVCMYTLFYLPFK